MTTTTHHCTTCATNTNDPAWHERTYHDGRHTCVTGTYEQARQRQANREAAELAYRQGSKP